MSTLLGEGVPFTDNGKIDGTQAATYTLPGIGRFVVESVVATIDASGSGDVTPELVIANPAGAVIATKRQGEAVSGGAPGSATWALRLADEGGSGASFSPVQATYSDPFGVSLGAGVQQPLPWVHASGAALLDLTVPAAPTIIAAGTYIFSCTMSVTPGAGGIVGRLYYGQLVVFAAGGLVAPTGGMPEPAGPFTAVNVSVGAPAVCGAGDGLHFTAQNGNTIAETFALYATVVRIA